MTLNDNIRISIFKKKNESDDSNFVHYWNNDDENFPDCSNIEDYLKKYTNYEWSEIQDKARFVRSKIDTATLTLNNSDRLLVDQVFVKVWYNDDSEIPQYYYGTTIDVMTNQNNPTNDYTLILELDKWSTFGCKMHGLMKSESMTQNFLANRKMCDRFKYQKNIGTEEEPNWVDSDDFIIDNKNYRLGLNYITQPWLLHSGIYDYPLIQATNSLLPEEESIKITGMTLEDWLDMNGCSKEQLEYWNSNGYISVINCKNSYSQSSKTGGTQAGKTGYVYNDSKTSLASQKDMLVMNDSIFNSNGKYRYLVVKFGSNNTWSYKLNTDPDSPEYAKDKEKIDAYSRASKQLYNATTGEVYYDLQQLLSDVVLGGGTQCIATKKVECVQSNSSTYEPVYLNGEAICLIPIPKGKSEQLYLFFLNSHDKGIVLGNGTIMGMVVNDIPPSIFASALRKYNEELNDPNMQTIGDKLSLRTFDSNDIPFAWTSLMLTGNWDWVPTNFNSNLHAHIQTIQDPQQIYLQPIFGGNGWYIEHYGTGIINWRYKFFDEENTPAGFYLIPPNIMIESPDAYWGYTKPKWELSFDLNGKWYHSDIDMMTWIDFTKYGTDEWACTKALKEWLYPRMAYFYFDGGNVNDESKWHLISGANKSYCKDGTYKLEETIIIPPATSEPGKWYRDISGDIKYEELYYNLDSSHYFPTIFHDFSYIPITVAHKYNDPIVGSTIKGQSEWFRIFNLMLNDKDIYSWNNRWSEPFLWGPQFYQWVYYNDGASKITLTADEIDWFKTYNTTWDINLRTNISSTTNLKLDITDIINDNYPFSKSSSEFIITDINKYPFTTEAYNNWFEQNAVAEATSKRAKDITNDFAQRKFNTGKWLNALNSTVSGAAAGGSSGTWQGAVIGTIAGAATGIAGMFLGRKKLNLEIEEANKKWANEWAGQYGNLYGQPARIEADGFTSGSLLYTPNGPADNQHFELFKMYTINPEARDVIGEEIFTSGYPYMKMCKYSDYDNRKNFNIINFNLDEKTAIVNHYLKREVSKDTLIFSQQDSIDWFKTKCKSRIRLFKEAFNYNNMDELIKTNTENSMKEE